ncbi:hypothetical protein [Botrimarina sp.]|uniref:hypothetical protein n=1 Tax=Botrimarina sp. TaxID=2795802 RepID=UPI0032F06BB2
MTHLVDRRDSAAPLELSGRCQVTARGPNWLFVTVESPSRALGLAERLRQIAASQFTYRMVVEFADGEGEADPARLASELRLLNAWLDERGGVLRLCGLRPEVAAAVLGQAGCSRLRSHASSYSAVWGGKDAEETVVETHPPRRPR